MRRRNRTGTYLLIAEAVAYARSLGRNESQCRKAVDIVSDLVKSNNTDRMIRKASKQLIETGTI